MKNLRRRSRTSVGRKRAGSHAKFEKQGNATEAAKKENMEIEEKSVHKSSKESEIQENKERMNLAKSKMLNKPVGKQTADFLKILAQGTTANTVEEQVKTSSKRDASKPKGKKEKESKIPVVGSQGVREGAMSTQTKHWHLR